MWLHTWSLQHPNSELLEHLLHRKPCLWGAAGRFSVSRVSGTWVLRDEGRHPLWLAAALLKFPLCSWQDLLSSYWQSGAMAGNPNLHWSVAGLARWLPEPAICGSEQPWITPLLPSALAKWSRPDAPSGGWDNAGLPWASWSSPSGCQRAGDWGTSAPLYWLSHREAECGQNCRNTVFGPNFTRDPAVQMEAPNPHFSLTCTMHSHADTPERSFTERPPACIVLGSRWTRAAAGHCWWPERKWHHSGNKLARF